MNVEGYERLAAVLNAAYEQASSGKGKERHAQNKPFHEQPMLRICESLGSPQFAVGQAHKKSREALGFNDAKRSVTELLGAINYLAGAVVYLEDQAETRQQRVFVDKSEAITLEKVQRQRGLVNGKTPVRPGDYINIGCNEETLHWYQNGGCQGGVVDCVLNVKGDVVTCRMESGKTTEIFYNLTAESVNGIQGHEYYGGVIFDAHIPS